MAAGPFQLFLQPEARAGLDLGAAAAVAVRRLRRTPGACTLAVSPDLAFAPPRIPWPGAGVAVHAVASDVIERAVIVHARMPPIVAVLALAVFPRDGRAAPIFAHDLVLSPGGLSSYCDVLSSRLGEDDWKARFATPLAAVQSGAFPRRTGGRDELRLEAAPDWLRPLTADVGGRAKGRLRDAPRASSYALEMLDQYLDTLVDAPETDTGASRADRETFARAMRDNGPAVKRLTRLVGRKAAERIGTLVRGEPTADLG
ncbi:MAG: hypothetical protein IT379_09865 [Deltaproteobacteria bacterium]|nr:hypothetical protein [Deltaproteobacteria bacterium]